MSQKIAATARKGAPSIPSREGSAESHRAYRAHFWALGGVSETRDTSGAWEAPRVRRGWAFPDGSFLVDDWASNPY